MVLLIIFPFSLYIERKYSLFMFLNKRRVNFFEIVAEVGLGRISAGTIVVMLGDGELGEGRCCQLVMIGGSVMVARGVGVVDWGAQADRIARIAIIIIVFFMSFLLMRG